MNDCPARDRLAPNTCVFMIPDRGRFRYRNRLRMWTRFYSDADVMPIFTTVRQRTDRAGHSAHAQLPSILKEQHMQAGNSLIYVSTTCVEAADASVTVNDWLAECTQRSASFVHW